MTLYRATPIDYRGNSNRFDYKPATTTEVTVELADLLADEFPEIGAIDWVICISETIVHARTHTTTKEEQWKSSQPKPASPPTKSTNGTQGS